MASTKGLVQRLTLSEELSSGCFFIGPSPYSTELLFIMMKPSDSVLLRRQKESMINLLIKAQRADYNVTAYHDQNSAEVDWVALGDFDISPIGLAIHNDFYSISGYGIPDNVEIVFDSTNLTITVQPDIVRPHWVFVAELPNAIPVGRNMVSLQAPGWSSDAVPIDVHAGPPATVRVLYSGSPRTNPYTVAFVANPAIESAAGGTFSADPVLTQRTDFHDAVNYCLRTMLTETEDLLRQNNLDTHIRFVTIFDSTLTANNNNSLAQELNPNLMLTRRDRLRPFLARYFEVADMVMVLHGSTTHDRATAWYTTDNANMPGTAYTYDGVNRLHGHIPEIPGSAAIPISVDQTGHTALHEFCHGASDFNNGRIWDLYHDGPSGGFDVNKKFRANNTDPIPNNFANYNGTNYNSDQNRNGIGYPIAWESYHPALIDPTRPNLMDNYWQAFDTPLRCRLDQLTYDLLSDRLRAKIFR